MKDRSDFAPLELPAELAALDEELSSLRYEERPSFAPELQAELEREWVRVRGRRRWPLRQLAAAAVAGLLMVGLGVPQARASLVRLVGALQGDVVEEPVPEAVSTTVPLPPVPAPTVPTEEGPTVEARIPAEPPAAPTPVAPYDGPEATFPELLDRDGVEALILRNYPTVLQQAGIGGTVRLLLWVDSLGSVEFVNLGRGSGVPELDLAAMQVAPDFRFVPARRRGQSVGTWVEFDVRFQVPPGGVDPLALPEVDPMQLPSVPEVPELTLTAEWEAAVIRPNVGDEEAGEQLRAAIGDDALIARLGPIEAMLQGEPPAGSAPTQWRSEVTRVLETAMARDPDNPAPLLALARIRRRQGLRTDARVLFERGLQRAQRSGSVSPTILGELHYERGALVKENWIASQGVGRLPADALRPQACPQARSSGGAVSGYASADRLIAWNYLCPAVLGEAFQERFEVEARSDDPDLAVMMASFRSAVEAYPAHLEANLEILLALADDGRWDDVLEGARRFVWASQGHPYGLLLEGLALQRRSRTEDARLQFELAFRAMTAEEVDGLKDISFLLDPNQEREYASTSGDEQAAWQASFWAPLDPILATDVNEREVEHLARAAYAFLRFGSFNSDPGQVWVRYGRPTDVRVVGDGLGPKTEFWDYGSGPDVTFHRSGGRQGMDLTSEGRAYLDDLRRVFPHRYGTESRLLFTLPGQLSRFRGASPGSWDLEVYTQVPELLASSGRDTLDVGLFLLDQDGRKVSESRRKIPATQAPVSMRASAPPEVTSVVVELFHERSGQAAALREATAPDRTGVVSASDLLLVGSAAPDAEDVRRGADWVEPLTLSGPEQVAALGVLFELYDAAASSSWYRLRAELEDRDSGEIIGLPIRPAGEQGFRPTWDRHPDAGPVTVEFLTVALNEAPPGRYVLRVVADLPEAGQPLILERELDRR
jgi:TonB family protein